MSIRVVYRLAGVRMLLAANLNASSTTASPQLGRGGPGLYERACTPRLAALLGGPSFVVWMPVTM